MSTPAYYRDVKIVLSKALEIPGLLYEFKTAGAALNFKQRCNKYRVMLRKQLADAESHLPGAVHETIFDRLVIRQVDDQGRSTRDGKTIRFDHEQEKGRLIHPESKEEIPFPSIPIDEEFD